MSDVELAGALPQKFYADMPPDQFAEKIGLKPDNHQQAAIDEQADLKTKGVDLGAGYTRRLAHGATLGADSTILAAALSPFEAIKRGVGLGEGYNYAKAREESDSWAMLAPTPALPVPQQSYLVVGVAGGALAPYGASRLLSSAPSLLGRTGVMAADAAGLGAVTGFNEGNGLQDRLAHAGQGALLGGAIGGGPLLIAAFHHPNLTSIPAGCRFFVACEQQKRKPLLGEAGLSDGLVRLGGPQTYVLPRPRRFKQS